MSSVHVPDRRDPVVIAIDTESATAALSGPPQNMHAVRHMDEKGHGYICIRLGYDVRQSPLAASEVLALIIHLIRHACQW